jgi:multicomponent Na+:H+ antiporter subunit E
MIDLDVDLGTRFRRLWAVRPMITMAALLLAWLALWGSASVGMVLLGIVVVVGVEMLGVGTAGVGRVRFVPLLELIGVIFIDLVKATYVVAKEIVTPGDHTNEGIIAVDLPSASRVHFLLFTVAITVTPGTAVVDADPATGTMYIHMLYRDDWEATAAHLRHLADLADRALPVDDDQAEVAS